jgi:hypothetical protein
MVGSSSQRYVVRFGPVFGELRLRNGAAGKRAATGLQHGCSGDAKERQGKKIRTKFPMVARSGMPLQCKAFNPQRATPNPCSKPGRWGNCQLFGPLLVNSSASPLGAGECTPYGSSVRSVRTYRHSKSSLQSGSNGLAAALTFTYRRIMVSMATAGLFQVAVVVLRATV